MNYYEHYRTRVNPLGLSKKDSLLQSSKDKFDLELADSPYSSTCLYDGTETIAMQFYEKRSNPFTSYQSQHRAFKFKSDFEGVAIGGIVELEDHKFIIYDRSDSPFLPSYYGLKVNKVLSLQRGKIEKIQVGTDRFNLPIYEEVSSPPFSLPCYATSNARFNEFTEFGLKINNPRGRTLAVLPYHKEFILNDGTEVHLDSEPWKVVDVDNTLADVEERTGITVLLLDREQKSKE